MTRYNHPAEEAAAIVPMATGNPKRDSHMPEGNQPGGDTQQVRSQLLKMIVASERQRHTDTTKPVVQR